MKLQAILSSAVLAAALSFSAPAFAQLEFEGTAVPTDQEQAVRDACAALLAEANASTIEQDDDDNANVDETETGSTGSESGQSSSPDPASEDYWDTTIAGLSVQDCRSMGL
jgi:hypothetical protein